MHPCNVVHIVTSCSPLQVNWKTLVAERDKDVLEEAIAVNNNQLILIYLRDVKVTLPYNL